MVEEANRVIEAVRAGSPGTLLPVRAAMASTVLLPVGLWWASHVVSDVGDGVFHYLAAHFAFAHPRLLLDAWCKPLFTLLAAPLASTGFAGMVLFQALVTLATAVLLGRIAKQDGWRAPWLAALLLYAAPGTWNALLSGLTEPLFGLLLVVALWSVERRRARWAYLVVGFLPFVRAEGWVLMVWWAALAARDRRADLVLALLCGHAVYGVVGTLFVYHDPLWMFRQNPYWVVDRSYGHGTWSHFFVGYPGIAGLPAALATGAAAVALVARRAAASRGSERSATSADDARWCDLYLGSFAAYFVAHVIFWRFGLFKSFGLTRVLVAVLPVAALVVAREVDRLGRCLPGDRGAFAAWGTAVVVAWYAMGDHSTALRLADRLRPTDQQRAVDAAVAWVRTRHATPADTPVVYSSNPYVALALDLDVFDRARARFVAELTDQPAIGGALVVWDSWFSVAEHGYARERLEAMALEERQHFRVDAADGGFYEVVTGRLPVTERQPAE